MRQKYFEQEGELFLLKEKYRKDVRFFAINLATRESPNLQGPYHIIFCRNLLIYFPEEIFHRVISHLARSLAPQGYLFLGHSESLIGKRPDFTPLCLDGNIIYQKVSSTP